MASENVPILPQPFGPTIAAIPSTGECCNLGAIAERLEAEYLNLLEFEHLASQGGSGVLIPHFLSVFYGAKQKQINKRPATHCG